MTISAEIAEHAEKSTLCELAMISLYVYSLSGNPFEWPASIQRRFS